eukprot:6200168-Pleurochrysis_carterae.AAC.1
MTAMAGATVAATTTATTAATIAATTAATTTVLLRVLFTTICATLPTTAVQRNLLIAHRRGQSSQPPVLRRRTHRFRRLGQLVCLERDLLLKNLSA